MTLELVCKFLLPLAIQLPAPHTYRCKKTLSRSHCRKPKRIAATADVDVLKGRLK